MQKCQAFLPAAKHSLLSLTILTIVFPFSASFSPPPLLELVHDGRHVLTASDDKTARLWEVETGQEVQRLEGHTAPVWSVAFAPSGRSAKELLAGIETIIRQRNVARSRPYEYLLPSRVQDRPRRPFPALCL